MTINALGIIPCKTAGCPTMGDYAIKKKMNVKWGGRKKGDIVLFDFNHNGTSDHIGIVVSVNSDGSITTVEGNTGSGSNTNGGQVQLRKRYKSQVNYFVRPKYTSSVTADMVIATARAEVGVKESPRNSNKVKYNRWFYGNNTSAYWCCTFVCWVFAHVKETAKPVPKPTGKYTGTVPIPTLKKGKKGDSVRLLQKFLNWYHPEWKLAVDGDFGTLTDNAVRIFQLTEGLEVDGIFGKNSYARAVSYEAPKKPVTKSTSAPKPAAKPAAKATGAQKIISKCKELAWAYGTAKKKYAYKTGAPKKVCKVAMKKYGWADSRAEMSDCGNFCSTVVRESGVSKSFKALHGVKTPFPKSEAGFTLVHSGKAIPSGLLKPGDIIRYKKQNGKQHAMMYYAAGKVCEASHKNRFGAIVKDTKRYNTQSKKNTIQVFRAK